MVIRGVAEMLFQDVTVLINDDQHWDSTNIVIFHQFVIVRVSAVNHHRIHNRTVLLSDPIHDGTLFAAVDSGIAVKREERDLARISNHHRITAHVLHITGVDSGVFNRVDRRWM
jgi:hypothetical protein